MHTAKKAGSIVLSFASKELADRVMYKGIFLDYDFHRVTAFWPYPAQCFRCLRMWHFGKWCRHTPRCGKCDDEHMMKDCPNRNNEIKEWVRCKEGIRNKEMASATLLIQFSAFFVLSSYCAFRLRNLTSSLINVKHTQSRHILMTSLPITHLYLPQFSRSHPSCHWILPHPHAPSVSSNSTVTFQKK